MAANLTRRRLLVAGGGLVGTALAAGLAGCDPFAPPTAGRSPSPAGTRPPAPDPLIDLAVAEVDLLAGYDRLLAAGAGPLEARLRGIRADHAAHLAALRAALPPAARPALRPASPSTSRSPSPSPSPIAGAAPTTSGLRVAEQAAADRLGQAALTAPAGRVSLLASIAASEASHATVLG